MRPRLRNPRAKQLGERDDVLDLRTLAFRVCFGDLRDHSWPMPVEILREIPKHSRNRRRVRWCEERHTSHWKFVHRGALAPFSRRFFACDALTPFAFALSNSMARNCYFSDQRVGPFNSSKVRIASHNARKFGQSHL